jgi:SWI/SNF-related matrix-associated actin-dependent regulator 1 of chromatin subfamily A
VKADKRLFLTGTPIVNRPYELLALLQGLEPEMWDDRKYVMRYAGAAPHNGWDTRGHKNLKELHDILRGTVMIRRLKSEVLKDLPPKTRKVVPLDPADVAGADEVIAAERDASGWQAGVNDKLHSLYAQKGSMLPEDYDEAKRAMLEELEMAQAKMMSVRHQTALAKAPHVAEYAKMALEETPKLVVFAHHLDVVAKIAGSLEGSLILTGETKPEERQALVDRFQDDSEIRVLVVGLTVGGLGYTFTAASRVIFAELDWRPATMNQAEDRLHRIGQKCPVLVEHVVLQGSIDENMTASLIEKQKVIDQALDDKGDERTERVPEIRNVTPVAELAKKRSKGTILKQRMEALINGAKGVA